MKKIFFILFALLVMSLQVDAQILRAEELEKYAMEKYGKKWVDAATNLASQLTLDKNNAITYVQVVPAEGKTKNQLYVLLNYWFAATFNDANSVIKLNDKEIGAIIAQGYVANIAKHEGGYTIYNVSIRPIIKCDIKDCKVRITFTVPYYDVVCMEGAGVLGGLTSGLNGSYMLPVRSDEKWAIDKCFPFVKKDSHKKTSCKALVMAHAYSNVVIDKIEECIKNGLSGNEGDDW